MVSVGKSTDRQTARRTIDTDSGKGILKLKLWGAQMFLKVFFFSSLMTAVFGSDRLDRVLGHCDKDDISILFGFQFLSHASLWPHNKVSRYKSSRNQGGIWGFDVSFKETINWVMSQSHEEKTINLACWVTSACVGCWRGRLSKTAWHTKTHSYTHTHPLSAI